MNAPSGPVIELWVEARGGAAAVNPVLRALLGELAAAGARVSVRVPEDEVCDPGRPNARLRPELVLLKSPTTLALSLAVADERDGVSFLNRAKATLRAHDKAAVIGALAAAGLPVPDSFLLDANSNGRDPPHASNERWVVKPVRGVHGRGVGFRPSLEAAVARAHARDGCLSPIVDDGCRLLQRQIGTSEPDVKVYVAGVACFAGRKRFGPASFAEDTIAPVELDRASVEVVRAAGEALGLRCFGVDLRYENGRAVVIDVNAFPGYRGFPDAVDALCAEVERALEAR